MGLGYARVRSSGFAAARFSTATSAYAIAGFADAPRIEAGWSRNDELRRKARRTLDRPRAPCWPAPYSTPPARCLYRLPMTAERVRQAIARKTAG
jgi:hypothetical protein